MDWSTNGSAVMTMGSSMVASHVWHVSASRTFTSVVACMLNTLSALEKVAVTCRWTHTLTHTYEPGSE